jgi:hypothetical protein
LPFHLITGSIAVDREIRRFVGSAVMGPVKGCISGPCALFCLGN